MIIVMGVMAASALFVAAAFSAANGDLPLTRDSQDRKQAYAAAEAGINYYQYHLNQDPDYWTRCTNVPRAERDREPAGQPALERHRHRPAPLAQGRGHADAVHDRAAAGQRQLAVPRGQPATMIDPATGTFKIRATGRPRAGSKLKRSLIVPRSAAARSSTSSTSPTSRRRTRSTTASNQTWAQAKCGDQYRAGRDNSCSEIQFAERGRDQRPVPHQRRHPDLRHAGVRAQQRGLDRVQRPGARLHQGRRQQLRG